jgi:hypothetical protein
MSTTTSQPSALNPGDTLEEVFVSGTRQGDRLDEVIVGGTRVGGDTLKEVVVTGTNAPIDGQRLEGVVVTGSKRKKAEPMHLYYPKALADPTAEFKNAIQFTVYQQNNSYATAPDTVPPVRQLPEQFKNNPKFPISAAGATSAFFLTSGINQAIPLLGSASQAALDLVGIGKFGLEYFMQGENSSYGKRTNRIDQSITLYMPDTMVNQDKHDYQPASLTAAAGRAGILSQLRAFGGSNIGGLEVAAELASKAGILGTRAPEALLAGYGYAVNPMLEMIYGGTQPREFLFQFRFAPRNKEEAQEVIKIIRAFRFHAATESAGGNIDTQSGTGSRYIVPPNQFEIQFLRRVNGRLEENLSIPRVATCMLAGINTNYAAQLDTFATTTDGVPASISLDLSFVESVVITKNDIGNGY